MVPQFLEAHLFHLGLRVQSVRWVLLLLLHHLDLLYLEAPKFLEALLHPWLHLHRKLPKVRQFPVGHLFPMGLRVLLDLSALLLRWHRKLPMGQRYPVVPKFLEVLSLPLLHLLRTLRTDLLYLADRKFLVDP